MNLTSYENAFLSSRSPSFCSVLNFKVIDLLGRGRLSAGCGEPCGSNCLGGGMKVWSHHDCSPQRCNNYHPIILKFLFIENKKNFRRFAQDNEFHRTRFHSGSPPDYQYCYELRWPPNPCCVATGTPPAWYLGGNPMGN